MRSFAVPFIAAALLSMPCAPASAADAAAEKASLLAAAKAFNESTGDLEKRMSFYADDVVRLSPGQGALMGKAAIKARAAELKALPGFTAAAETKSAEVAASGDLGYTFSTGKVTVLAGGKTLTVPGHSLTVWKKQGGAWKVVADALSTTPGAESTQ